MSSSSCPNPIYLRASRGQPAGTVTKRPGGPAALCSLHVPHHTSHFLYPHSLTQEEVNVNIQGPLEGKVEFHTSHKGLGGPERLDTVPPCDLSRAFSVKDPELYFPSLPVVRK